MSTPIPAVAHWAVTPNSSWLHPTGTEKDWPDDLAEQHRAYQRDRAVGPLIAAGRGLYSSDAKTLPDPIENCDDNCHWAGSHQAKPKPLHIGDMVPLRTKPEPPEPGVADHMRATGSLAMVIPLYQPGDPDGPSQLQLRLDTPRTVRETKGGETVEKKLKFELPVGVVRGINLGDLPADVHPQADPEAPVQIWTEGQAKADAVLTAAWTEGLNLCPVTFTGVTMPTLRVGHPEGSRWEKRLSRAVTGALDLVGKTIFLAWDHDWRTNRSVRNALVDTGRAIVDEEPTATVLVVDVPAVAGDQKAGVDDYLAWARDHKTSTPLAALLRGAITFAEAELIAIPYPATDAGRAARLADEMVRLETWRLNSTRQGQAAGSGWMSYSDGVWRDDAAGAFALATRLLERDPDDAAGASERSLRAALNLASRDSRLLIEETELDADLWALNARNGTVDLRTGLLRPHDPQDLATRQITYDYSPTATAPTFDRFLQQTFGGNPEVIRWVQLKLGESLIGDLFSDGMTQCVGGGQNGKSTLLTGVVLPILGPYARLLDPAMLTGKGAGDTDLAELQGSRLVVFSETDAEERLNSARFKQIVGREPIHARRLYQSGFTFSPTATTWLMTNHRLKVQDASLGAWRRMSLLPFLHTVSKRDADPLLPRKLLAEAPGILAWMVAGAVEFHRLGDRIPDCPAITAATEAYRQEEDQLAGFIGEYLVKDPAIGDPAAESVALRTSRSAIYETYRAWASFDAGMRRVWTARAFWAAMTERGVMDGLTETKVKGERHLVGIGLSAGSKRTVVACELKERLERGLASQEAYQAAA